MEKRCRFLMFFAFCTLSACDALDSAPATAPSSRPDAAPGQPLKLTNPRDPAGAALGESSVLAALESERGLQVAIGNFALRLSATGCGKFAGDLVLCNRDNRLEIAGTTGSFKQALVPDAVVVDASALAYRGLLTAASKPGAHTFVMSDVNGDKRDDLIIWSGREGAYGGPSFDVYLFDAVTPAFRHSQPFSDLTVGYLGLFGVEDGKIRTASKSGCCIHVYETYAVEKDTPRLTERVTEDTTSGAESPRVTIERLVDGELKRVEQ